MKYFGKKILEKILSYELIIYFSYLAIKYKGYEIAF